MTFSGSFLHPSNWFFPPSRRYRLEVSASEKDIIKTKDFTQAVCKAAGYTEADSHVVQSVLEELCGNIFRNAYRDKPYGRIQFEISIGWMGLRIHVTDQGQRFDFKGVKDPDLNRRLEIGGKKDSGLWFIPPMTVRLRVLNYPDHNEWILHYRPSGRRHEGQKGFGLSLRFVLVSLVFFSFLMLMVYVLSCLFVAPAIDTNDSIIRRINEGSGTSLGRGIQLVYGLGLAGFFFIFYKFLNPFREMRKRSVKDAQPRDSNERTLPDRNEYERLVGVISEMEDQLRDSERKMAEHEKMELEMRVMVNARQEETRQMEQAREELERFSQTKEDLNRQLQDARMKMAAYENEREEKRAKADDNRQGFFPEIGPQVEGFQIGISYRTAKNAGGNYCDFNRIDPITLGVALGDVDGREADRFTSMTELRAATRLAAWGNKSPADVLIRVHRNVNQSMKKGVFASLFYMILDARNRSIGFASAGRKRVIFYHSSTDEMDTLNLKGFPLGTALPEDGFSSKSFTSRKVYLQKEDLLVICTDGVTRAMNAAGEEFGENRWTLAIRNNAHLPAEELVQKLRDELDEFTAGVEPADDMTILAVKENWPFEDAVYRFRKNLLNCVEKDGLSVVEACQKAGVFPQTYFYYKTIHDKKGDSGLKPIFSKKIPKELSPAQKKAVISAVKSHPEWEPGQITAFLKRNFKPASRLEVKTVSEFLSWKGLDESRARKVFAANAIDTV